MGEMMETLTLTDFGVDKEEEKRIKAELKFAVNIGLIQNDSPKAIDERRIMKNHQNEEDTLINKIVYGITSYSREAYIRPWWNHKSCGNPDAYIADNEFYVREDTPFLRKNMSDGKYELVRNKVEV